MAGFERAKRSLDIQAVPQQRVDNLQQDLSNLMGVASQGMKVADTIGVTAAELDFRDMSFNASRKLSELDRRMTELPADDADGFRALMDESEGIKRDFTVNASKYKDHKDAFDSFTSSTAELFGKIDAKENVYNQNRHKAEGLQNLNAVSADGELGLDANYTSFSASKKSLVSHLGEDKALETTQVAYFEPLYAQASINRDSKTIDEEMSVVDGALGYATREKVADFINSKVLNKSEMASLYITKDIDGNETFAVKSSFTDTQNAKLIAMANFYMGKHAPASNGEKQYPYLNALDDVTSKTVATIPATDSIYELQAMTKKLEKQFSDYELNPEYGTIEKDSPQHQKLYKTNADAMTAINKRTAILNASNSGRTVAENTASPLTYEIKNFAVLMHPEQGGTHSVGLISNDELKASYKHFDNESLAAFQANDSARATMLSDKYKRLTGEPSQLDGYIKTLVNSGISTATTVKEVSAQKELITKQFNSGHLSQAEYYTAMRGLDAQITHADKDGKLTPASHTGMKTAMESRRSETWTADPENQKKLKAAKQSPWLSDAKITSATFQETEQMLVNKGLMKHWDNPEAVGKLVAENLVYGMNKTLLPKLDASLDENQMVKGMSQFIRQYAKQKNIKINPETISIGLDPSKTTYLVHYKLSSGTWSTDNILISPKQIAIHADYIKRNPSMEPNAKQGKDYVHKYRD